MELGGHAPAIGAEDADVARDVEMAGPAKLRLAGGVCISPARFLAHDSLREEFARTQATVWPKARATAPSPMRTD